MSATSVVAAAERIAARAEAAPTRQRRLGWLVRAVAGLAFALLAVALRLPELDRYATIDESRWVSRAADFSTYIQQRDWDKTYLVGHPGVTTMWLGSLGMGPARVRAMSYLAESTDVTRRDDYLDALVAARKGPLVANALALGLCVWLAWGLFGAGPALLGGLLLLSDPFLAAHSRLIHLDALLTSCLALAALASIAFWSGGSWLYLLLAGLASGLALLTKAPSVYLVGFLPALALLQHLRGGWRQRRGWLRLASGLAIVAGLAGALCLALWPALRLRPQLVLRQMAEFTLKNGSGERENFFLGRPVEDPGPLFYPLATLFRATPLLLLGLALLAFFLVRERGRLSKIWPALLVGGFAVGFILMMTLGQKKFDRYVLPAFPLLDLLAGYGLWLGWMRIAGRLWPDRKRPPVPSLAAAGGLGVLLAALPMLSVYPYYLAYYNPLLGGGPAAQRAIFVGWGEGMDRVAGYVNARPLELGAPLVATAYHRVLQAHLRGNNAMPIERAELADYIVPYVNSLQRDQDHDLLAQLVGDREPERSVWLNGIEYARIYRGPHFPVERAVGAELEQRLRLESLLIAPGSGTARPGYELQMRLRWRPLAEPGTLIAITRLLAPDGRVVLQERQPLARALREGELLLVDQTLRLPTQLPPGDYRLQALVDDPSLGRALALPTGEAAVALQSVRVLPAASP
jgi:4-amino-4-deoxy-L-arabinose transferase-like glycosyltransferase